jgi:hypothetical protein
MSSSRSEYRRPRRVIASSSYSVVKGSSSAQSSLTPKQALSIAGSNESEGGFAVESHLLQFLLQEVLTSPTVPLAKKEEPVSDKEAPTYLTLLRYITTYLIEHDDIISTMEAVALATISDAGNTLEQIGMGATFEVSSAPISPGAMLDHSWPRRLKLSPFGRATVSKQTPQLDQSCRIVHKRPRIRLSGQGANVSDVDTERLEAILLEIRALTHPPLFYHKNVVDFLGIAWDREVAVYDTSEWEPEDSNRPPVRVPVLLLENARHGSLADLTETEMFSQLPFEARASLCRDVAEGLAALHKCGIVHGDVKPDNILIFDAHNDDESRTQFGLRAKIGDFGFSVAEHSHNTMFTLVGRTWPWNDPEWNQPRTWHQLQKTDVYSYGLLAWTILTRIDLGQLFDIDFAGVDVMDAEIRACVEDMKDWTLRFNAASYFAKEDAIERLLVELLFAISLERAIEFRGTMIDVAELWNTWFTGLGYVLHTIH